jgi:hypothetical protein
MASGRARIARAFGERAELAASYGYFVQTADLAPRDVRRHAVDLSLAMRIR